MGSPASKPSETSVAGLISFFHGLGSAVGWFVYVATVGAAASAGLRGSKVNQVVGLAAFLGIFLNLVGLIFGIMGAVRSQAKSIAIIGAIINGLEIAAVVGLIAYGLSIKH